MKDEVDVSQNEPHHRSVDVPEGSLLTVKDLPLSFILFPVNPADRISQCEKHSTQLSSASALHVTGESGWRDKNGGRHTWGL